jgi:hypothetical protein
MATFFNKTYTIAEEAKNGLSATNVKVAVLEQCVKGIDLSLVKMDLKLDTLLATKGK